MNKKIAELTVDRWNEEELIKVLMEAGFILTLNFDGIGEKHYTISVPMKDGDF